MPHTIEPAASGRATCRGCGQAIAKGELRFGERLPNPFADEGEVTLWFHLVCGALKRPESLLEALAAARGDGVDVPDAPRLAERAREGVEHRRLPRVDGAERASTGRARCRSCREPIARGDWRIRLVFFEEARFEPSGFVHVRCAREYFGTAALMDRLRHFSPELGEPELSGLEVELAPSGAGREPGRQSDS